MKSHYYLLRYSYVSGVIKKRAPLREKHLELCKGTSERGLLLLGGALDPPDEGYLVFKGSEREIVEQFVLKDPYVVHQDKVVSSWRLSKWNVAVGRLKEPERGEPELEKD